MAGLYVVKTSSLRHSSVCGFTQRIHGIKLNKTAVQINECNAELMLDTQVLQGQLNCSV